MAPWGAIQRQLLAYIARNPQIHKMVREGADKVTRSPQFRKAQDRVKTYYDAMLKKGAAPATGRAQQQQQQQQGDASGGPQFSFFNQMRRRLLLEWHKHKGRMFAFVTANFFFIIMMLQFAGGAWHGLVSGFKALTAPSSDGSKRAQRKVQMEDEAWREEGGELHDQSSKRRRRKKIQPPEDGLEDEEAVEMHRNRYMSDSEREVQKQNAPKLTGPFSHLTEALGSDEADTTHNSLGRSPSSMLSFSGASDPPPSSQLSTMFDDTVLAKDKGAQKNVAEHFNEMHRDMFQGRSELNGVTIDFNTSFLVKMGDETEFTSSLERENLTGNMSNY